MSKNKDLLVTTVKGNRVPRSQTKRIIGEYYEIGDSKVKDSGSCYLVDGKYHRFNNGLIEYDHELGQYVLLHKTHLKHGVVGADVNDKPIEGYFSANITKNVILIDDKGKQLHCLSDDVARKIRYREKLGDGCFYERTRGNANWFNKIQKAPVQKTSLPYDSRFATKINSEQYDKYYSPIYDNPYLNIVGDFLEKYGITFGLEFETTVGYIPDRLCYKYGLIALRDGSITGLEYVTIPYSGRKGLYAVREICKELKKRTKYDTTCALHLHLGGITRDKKSIVSSYILAYLVQDDMYSLQPAFKKGGTGIRNKDYCVPIPQKHFLSIMSENDIDKQFDVLFSYISDGVPFTDYKDLKNVKYHPSDPNGTSKWHIKSRYKWINFVPIVFTNHKTLEFRHHSSTYEVENIMNFIVTCAMFIYIAENYADEVLDVKSKLHKALLSKTKNSIEVFMGKCLGDHPNFKDIVNRVSKYNAERQKIMTLLYAKKDYAGDTESKYNSDIYSKLNGDDFWIK